jgi:hypothetical protein|tara:strand:+ start:111 stop:869 length:759 start_codon:yes stop_codon:yes gene_type:complete
MANNNIMNQCPPGQHMMSDGTCMQGDTHPVGEYNAGGILQGPSHEQGGIPAIVGGTTPVELEGGEYIVNAETVNVVGQEFLDELNSTQTSHHTGGFTEGQLPSPSQFKNGGKVNGRNNMARGRRAPVRRKGGNAGRAPAKRRMASGGRPKTRKMQTGGCPPGQIMANGGCMPSMPSAGNGGYRKGGRTKPQPKRKGRAMARGGMTQKHKAVGAPKRFANGGRVNGACKHLTGTIDCAHQSGCNWNYSTSMCH